jgi:hypothetical protein
MTTMKQLIARQESTQREFEAARDAAERIANEENEALVSDDSYSSWLRRKKLADLDLARLKGELASVADEIQAEEGRQQRDALLKRYNTVKARNEALQARVSEFRETMAPVLLQLIHDLAQDEVEVEAINRRVPWGERLRSADATVRCCPSEQISETNPYFSPADDVPPLWRTLVIPRLGQYGGPLFDGTQFNTPERVLQFLERD